MWMTSCVHMAVAQASVTINEPNVELYLHTDTTLVVDNCLVINWHKRPVNGFSDNVKDGHKCARTFNTAVCYDNPYS